jgi:hypothetical protein
VLDRTGDASEHRNISNTYIKKWEEYGIARDGKRAKLAYDWYGSWTTLYSLYSDALLCFHPEITGNGSSSEDAEFAGSGREHQTPMKPTPELGDEGKGKGSSGRTPLTHNFIPHHIYKIQSDWYATAMQKYGLPLDSRHLYTKSDWQFFAAATAEEGVRGEILDRVARWLNETVRHILIFPFFLFVRRRDDSKGREGEGCVLIIC